MGAPLDNEQFWAQTATMTTVPLDLVADLLEFVGPSGRPYPEVLDAWRTSCPRLSIWEDARALGLLETTAVEGSDSLVVVTISGQEFLATHRG